MNGIRGNPVVYDALEAYFLANPDVAISLFRDNCEDTPVFDRDWLDGLLDTMKGSLAFEYGLRAEIDPYDEWFEFDAYDNIRSVPYDYVESVALDFVMSDDFKDMIISGKVDFPDDLERIVRLWGPGGMERDRKYPYEEPLGSPNTKGRRCRR